MAEELQNRKRNLLTGETWEESFRGVEKTSKAFHDLVEEFTKWVGDYHEFADYQRDEFKSYIENLDSVETHWEDINTWVKENSGVFDQFTGSLSDALSTFKSIVAEAGGIKRQTVDSVNIFRQLTRLASDGLAISQQEGGISENALKSLDRRKAKIDVLYKAQLRQLGVLDEKSGELDEDKANVLKESSLKRIEDYEARLDRLNGLRRNGIQVDRQQIRDLEDRIKYQNTLIELVDKENNLARKGLNDLLDRQKELFRLQSKGRGNFEDLGRNAFGDRKVNVVTKVLGKLGFQEEAGDISRSHGDWKTVRVVARQNVDIKQNALKEAQAGEVAAKNRYDAAQLAFDSSDISKQIAAKTAELEKKVQDQKAIENLDFSKISDEEFEKLAASHNKLQSAIVNLGEELSELRKQEKDLTNELEGSKAGYAESSKAVKDKTEDLNKAKTTWEDIQNVKFEDILKSKIKDVFSDIPGLIAKVGVLLGALIYRQLLKFDEEAVKTKRVIGQWADASALANTKFVTGTEVLKTMRDLGEQFHINPVQVFSSQELGRIAEAQKLTGMSAQAAGNLGVQSKIIGKNADSYRDSIAAGANQANKLNHSAVNLSAVQNDVLNTSRAITMSYGQNVEGLARAASTAASLGMNLQDVENISRNLINFQSSIEAEMQAQLLTGQQLNLARARELALNNDLEGVAKEISSQGVDAAKFSHMNLIQQENMAKALGMSREQMSKMLIMQEINKGLTAQQVAAMTGMRKEDIEALSAQEKWQTMKQRFLETLVPLLEPVLQVVSDIFRLLNPLIGVFSTIAGWISRIFNTIPENWTALRALVGVLAVGIPVALLKGINLIGVFKKGLTGIAGLTKKIGTSIGGWITKLKGAGTASQATQAMFDPATKRWRDLKTGRFVKNPNISKTVSDTAKAQDTASKVPTGSRQGPLTRLGKDIKGFFNQLAGIKWGGIAKAAVGVGLMMGSLALFALVLRLFEGISWGTVLKGIVSLGVLTGAFILLGTVMSSGVGTVAILAGAAAMVVMAGAIALLGVALKQFEGISWESIGKLPVAMGALALAGLAAVVAGPALLYGSIMLIPGAYALAQAFKVLATAEDVNTANILQTIKDLKSIEIPEVSNFQRLQKIAQILVRTSRRLRNASFRPLENLSNLGTGLSSTANALVRVGEAIGLIATNLNQLDSEKLSSLRSSRLSGSLARIRSRLQERVENLKETTGSQKETIAAANQEVTVKKANQNTATQQISIEQRATDLKVIERKLDNVIAAIGNSRPDWDWVKFEQARTRNLSWVK